MAKKKLALVLGKLIEVDYSVGDTLVAEAIEEVGDSDSIERRDEVKKLLGLTDDDWASLSRCVYEDGRTFHPGYEDGLTKLQIHVSLCKKLGLGIGDIGADV